MAAFKDHFSTHNAGYAAHRPTYPSALVDFLAEVAPARNRALDVGCGTGQLAVLLADRFAEVTAIDASAQQIASATAHPAVTYAVAPAEHSGLPDGVADLVTVAQAAHWLDLDPFYAEVRRITRPGGILALVTYGVFHIDDAAADTVAQRFYYDAIGPYWPPERRHVEDGYRSLPFPFPEIEAPSLDITVVWKLRDLFGYVDTWSAVRAAEKAVGRAEIDAFHAELSEAWGDPDAIKRVSWPLSLRIGRVS